MLLRSYLLKTTAVGKPHRQGIIPFWHQRRNCGLLAAVHLPDKHAPNAPLSQHALLTDRHVLDQTTERLQHRGPDGRHVAMSSTSGNSAVNSSSGKVQWSLGHQRLAIVDPLSSTADMPFLLNFGKENGGNVKLVANGEIYNHKSVYQQLVNNHGWNHPRQSHSDCEVIAHAVACVGPEQTARMLDGMFAFVSLRELDNDNGDETSAVELFAARDPVGIKPLYIGVSADDTYIAASELKALVGHVVPGTVQAVPAGHYWTPSTGMVRYHEPAWLYDDTYAPWLTQNDEPSDGQIREAFQKAVQKRMMADVEYGFFLSGGVDSCIVAHTLMPLYRQASGDDRPIPAFTVGMEDSPDLMASKALVEALGGSRYIDHRPRTFAAHDVLELIPTIIYHMETYEAELIRSAIPNWLLAERAGADVKMVLTGEGADELFAGYLYFMDATTPDQVQQELKRIYKMLGNINLHRTDRMTMAHGLEARVPFLDTEFTKLIMSVNPARKMISREAVSQNAPGREKTLLRELFAGPNSNGHSIPKPVLWRAKAMQCEGVGEDWVSILQRHISNQVSDAELAEAARMFPENTPQTKEEVYYRRIFEEHFPGLAHVVHPWEGGCRAAGAAWESDAYTREGLQNTNLLTHAFQKKATMNAASARSFMTSSTAQQRRNFSAEPVNQQPKVDFEAHFQDSETIQNATASGYDFFEAMLTYGGDDRSLIQPETGKNKYYLHPQPLENAIFRGSCTCNAPTIRGYQAALKLYENKFLTGTDMNQTLKYVFDDQRKRIAACLEVPEGTEVVLCPSGSDAEYIPVAMARSLNPMAEKVVNIVTQLKEIGAGSSLASGGQYFSTQTPLAGRVSAGEQLQGFDFCSEVCIPARGKDGSVIDASAKATEAAQSAEKDGAYAIVHGVFGGKTGLRDETMPASKNSGKSSMGIVDACQGRFTLDELHEWLEQDSVVLFTASKFYQAPPFCGAILIPKRIATQLRDLPPPEPIEMLGSRGLGGFLTDKELPECMDSWKPLLRSESDLSNNNIGLALRWEAGLAAMEALAGKAGIDQAVEDWATRVEGLVQRHPELDSWCVERSIVSIRVRKSNKDNEWFSMSELRDVYRYMSMDISSAVPASATAEETKAIKACCHLGQPVDVAESHAILRIALGAESLAEYLENPEETLREDETAIRKLSTIAKYFDHIKNSKL